jgi:hypothetical protein
MDFRVYVIWCPHLFRQQSSHTVDYLSERRTSTQSFLARPRICISLFSFSTLSPDEDSGRLLGKREKARRQEQLEKELKVKVRATLLLVVARCLVASSCLRVSTHIVFFLTLVEMELVRS